MKDRNHLASGIQVEEVEVDRARDVPRHRLDRSIARAEVHAPASDRVRRVRERLKLASMDLGWEF